MRIGDNAVQGDISEEHVVAAPRVDALTWYGMHHSRSK